MNDIYIYIHIRYTYIVYIYTVMGMRPVSPLENIFTGAIWVFGCCFFLPRRFTQMTLPLKVRASLKRSFNHNHPVSNWKERIHYEEPLKSWLNSPYLSPLRIVASYSDTRRFCGKNAVESNLETHFFGVQSTNLGLCQVEKYSLCPVYAVYEDTCQSDPERFGGNCWCGMLWMLLFMLAYRMRSDAESSPNCTVY